MDLETSLVIQMKKWVKTTKFLKIPPIPLPERRFGNGNNLVILGLRAALEKSSPALGGGACPCPGSGGRGPSGPPEASQDCCRLREASMCGKNGIGGEVRHGVTSGVSCETSQT